MFGPHVHRAKLAGRGRPGLATHVAAARAAAAKAGIDMRAAQVYVAGPQSLKMILRPEEAAELRSYQENSGIFIVAHGTYLDIPWSARGPFICKFIREEAALCASAGIAGLVIHLGAPPPGDVVASLSGLLEPRAACGGAADPSAAPDVAGPSGGGAADPSARASAVIYLEVPHIKPERSHYETPAKLAALFRQIRAQVDPELCRFGLCVDTAHLWASGVDLSSRAAAEAWLAGLEAAADVIPSDRVIFHLNDNFRARGSGGDMHAPFFQGLIWEGYADRPKESGLAAFVEYAVRRGIPTILERNSPARSGVPGVAPPATAASMLASDYNVLFDLTDAARLRDGADAGF